MSSQFGTPGSVADKTSICDTEPEEHDRQHTLQLAAVHADKDGYRWNLIDTPGYPEFVADSLSAMFGTELTVGVVSCASGATFNLRTKMKQSAGMGRGRAIIVTHVDGENVDFETTVLELRAMIGESASKDQQMLMVDGQSLQRRTVADLLVLLDRFESDVRREKRAADIAAGVGRKNNVQLRFQ